MGDSIENARFSYEVTFRFKNNKYHFSIPELGLIRSADSIQEAYDNLILKKDKIIKEYEESGNLDMLTPPKKAGSYAGAQYPGSYSTSGVFKIFLIKTGIVIAAILLIFFIVNEESEDMVNRVSKLKPVNEIARQLKMSANSKFDLKDRDEAIQHIRILVNRYKPVVDEIAQLFPCK